MTRLTLLHSRGGGRWAGWGGRRARTAEGWSGVGGYRWKGRGEEGVQVATGQQRMRSHEGGQDIAFGGVGRGARWLGGQASDQANDKSVT